MQGLHGLFGFFLVDDGHSEADMDQDPFVNERGKTFASDTGHVYLALYAGYVRQRQISLKIGYLNNATRNSKTHTIPLVNNRAPNSYQAYFPLNIKACYHLVPRGRSTGNHQSESVQILGGATPKIPANFILGQVDPDENQKAFVRRPWQGFNGAYIVNDIGQLWQGFACKAQNALYPQQIFGMPHDPERKDVAEHILIQWRADFDRKGRYAVGVVMIMIMVVVMGVMMGVMMVMGVVMIMAEVMGMLIGVGV